MAIEIKLDKQRVTKKGFSIILYINFKGKRKNIATNYSNLLKDWDENKLEPKKTHPLLLKHLYNLGDETVEKVWILNFESTKSIF